MYGSISPDIYVIEHNVWSCIAPKHNLLEAMICWENLDNPEKYHEKYLFLPVFLDKNLEISSIYISLDISNIYVYLHIFM